MRELEVRLRFADDDVRTVARLAEDRRRVWVELDSAFQEGGFELSPWALPTEGPRLREHRVGPGVPIPGVFNDSRPDGWGLRLLHRALLARGRPAGSVSPLAELAYLGQGTLGALTYHPTTGPEGPFDDAISLAGLAVHARRVYDDKAEEVLPALIRAGGSPGGVRPKALIGLRDDGGPGVRFGEVALPPAWSAWLVKFPATHDDTDVARREWVWMQLASSAGLDVPETRLLDLEGVGPAFAVRRFDRPGGNRRLHVLSAAGALDADFRTAFIDYRDLLRLSGVVCGGDQSQVLATFRLAAFNVGAVNEDDHLRNFAFLCSPAGEWRLAPGYDLTYAPRPAGVRTTTVAGVEKDVSRQDLLALAASVGVPARRAEQVLDEVVEALQQVGPMLKEARCHHAVSRAAIAAVETATARLHGGPGGGSRKSVARPSPPRRSS